MTVTCSNFTLVFRVGCKKSNTEYTSVSVTGSVPRLGMWLLNAAPSMEYSNDTCEWRYSLHLVQPPQFIEYCFVFVDEMGETREDLKRCFIVPENVCRLLSASSKGTKVLVEIVSFFDIPASTVSIFTPGVSLNPPSPEKRMSPTVYRQLISVKKLISEMRRENEFLRDEVHAISASVFARPKPDPQKLIKQLLTEINELKGKVKVICRIRPLLFDESDEFSKEIDNSNISILDACAYRDFEFDHIALPEVGNEELYCLANLGNLIQTSVMIGNNVCVFAYGQTGSGKSHTMLGPTGLVELAVRTVFHTLGTQPAFLTLEMTEIYRETVFPLIIEQPVYSADQVLSLFKTGVALRATAATKLNATSSRSHCIFRLTVNESASIFLVDLAGSERTKLSGASGDRLAEANSINKSLSALGLVLNSLLNKRSFIPYRDSKLTKLLAPVFTKTTPPSKVVMIANISPALQDLRESVSTLQFAQRVCSLELKGGAGDDEGLIAEKTLLIQQLLET